jgi:lactoylglutathione lyase
VPTSLRLEIFPADLNATVRFYVDLLGFSIVEDRRTDQLPYISLARDGFRLGAVAVPGGFAAHRHPPTGEEIVVEVDYLHAERDRIARAGWPIEEDITLRPWGLKDFRILDPDGYYLRFTTHGR